MFTDLCAGKEEGGRRQSTGISPKQSLAEQVSLYTPSGLGVEGLLELAFHKECKSQSASVPFEPSLCFSHQAGSLQVQFFLKKNQ